MQQNSCGHRRCPQLNILRAASSRIVVQLVHRIPVRRSFGSVGLIPVECDRCEIQVAAAQGEDIFLSRAIQ